jgi:hypothetical protein
VAGFVAVYDACVLYPAPLRDLLMHLALSGLYHARWTERIHREWGCFDPGRRAGAGIGHRHFAQMPSTAAIRKGGL